MRQLLKLVMSSVGGETREEEKGVEYELLGVVGG